MRYLVAVLVLSGCLEVEPTGLVQYELPMEEECDAGTPDAIYNPPQPKDCGVWVDSTYLKARSRGLANLQNPDIRISYTEYTSCNDALIISAKLYYNKSWVHPIPTVIDLPDDFAE